jgi:2-methylcitrate dehydratase PrpD
VIALRGRVHAVVDAGIDEASADVTVTMNDGRTHHLFVEHAIGSLERPMSDEDLARKFHGLVDPASARVRADELIRHSVRLASADNLRSLTALARPGSGIQARPSPAATSKRSCCVCHFAS